MVQIAENDILHDKGEAYACKLDETFVPTTITEYKGFIHDYGMLNPLEHIPAVKTSILYASTVLKSAFFLRNNKHFNIQNTPIKSDYFFYLLKGKGGQKTSHYVLLYPLLYIIANAYLSC